MEQPKQKIGIVFSGGAIRGIAHAGMLKALLERKIIPKVVAGTSTGSAIAALYADGRTPDEILEIFHEKHAIRLLKLKLPYNGFFSTGRFVRFVLKHMKARTFEELQMPLFISAANYNTGKQTTFSSGNLYLPLKASSSLPIVFRPVEIDGQYYVDGGIACNLPTEPIRDHCDLLIGCNVNPYNYEVKPGGFLWSVEQTIRLVVNNNIYNSVPSCDLYLEPQPLDKYFASQYSKLDTMFKIGYDYAKQQLDNLEEIGKLKAFQS